MHKRRCAAALALLLAVAACTRNDGNATGSDGRHAWTHAHHLRIGTTQEPDSLNKLFANSDAADQVASLIFAPLFRYDPQGNLVPDLATTVPTTANGGISRDNKTITLHFRPNAQWSDGAPLDARDFRFTWRAVMNPKNNTRLRVGWDDITAIDLPDRHTAVVHLREANADVFGAFGIGGFGYPPLPEHLLRALPDLNHAPFNSAPIASGPFMLASWNHGGSLELIANPHYWRGAPHLRAITIVIIPNSDTLLNALQTHDVDVYESVGEEQIARLGAVDGIRTVHVLGANWRRLLFNCSRPLLRDVRVRRAIAEAVDWEHINRVIYHGFNERAVSDVYPHSWAAPHIAPVRYDVADAKRLLAAAGFMPGSGGVLRNAAGEELRFVVSATTAKQANEQAELQMQQQLRDIGVALTIKNYPASLMFAQTGPLYSGRFDLETSIETNGPDPDNEGEWSGAFIPPHGANTSFLNDPVITRTSHEALRTFDHARRKALYQQEEDRIHALTPAVFMYWQEVFTASNTDLHGFRPAPFITNYWNAWEWDI